MAGAARLFVEQSRKLVPISRLLRPGKRLTVLAGPEANAFMARYEEEFLTTRLPWEDFDSSLATVGSTRTSQSGDGEVNRQRRARSSRGYSRAQVINQLPRMIEITHEFTQTWLPGSSVAVLPSMQRLVAGQLGQLLVPHGQGGYLQDFITYLA